MRQSEAAVFESSGEIRSREVAEWERRLAAQAAPWDLERFHRLAARYERGGVALRDLMGRGSALRTAVSQIDGELVRIVRATPEPALRRAFEEEIGRERREKTAALDRLAAEERELALEIEPLGRVTESCRRALKNAAVLGSHAERVGTLRGLDESGETSPTPVPIPPVSLPKDPLSALATVREQVADAMSELQRVERAPASMADAERRIDAWLRAKANERIPIGSQFVASGGGPNVGIPLGYSGNLPAPELNVASLLVWIAGDRVRELLLAEASDHLTQHGPGIDEAERLAQLKVIGQRLEQLEVREEGLVRAAEESRYVAPRRADAKPEIVLGKAA